MRVSFIFAIVFAFVAMFSASAMKVEEGLKTNETIIATVPTPEDNGLMLKPNLPGSSKDVPPMFLATHHVHDEDALKEMNTLKPAAMI